VYLALNTLLEGKIINKDTIFFDPCNGEKSSIVSIIKKQNGSVVYSNLSDFPEQLNSLSAIDQTFDIIITKPPRILLYDFIEKCIQFGKPFALLISMSVVFSMKWLEKCEGVKLLFQVIYPKCSFIHEKKKYVIGNNIAWVYGNVPHLFFRN
jgi:hypothetical protein